MTAIPILRVLSVLLTVVVAGCVGAGRVVPARLDQKLEVLNSVELATPAVGICRDGDGLLVLENSGTRVLRLNRSLVTFDTLPLSERITAPAGIEADRFYVYVYDNNVLSRMSKEKLVLQSWLGNVLVAGLAGYDVGVMLVSDARRGSIWYKGLFGESRRFISQSEIARPGAMAALPGGVFAALDGGDKLAFFNRSGVVNKRLAVPEGTDLLVSDADGLLWLGGKGRAAIWRLADGRLTGFALPDSAGPVALAAFPDAIAVLDAGSRITLFAVPGR
jgi:hypothetical protein